MVVAAAAAVVVVVVVCGGKLAFGAGKRLGQRACFGRVAQGQGGGGMLVFGVFENIAGRCVLDFDLKNTNCHYFL